ncbi:hypothetical protein VB151_13050 [Xanthomonas fragariae]|uniref:Putative peptidoglycan binding domain-containing protein n=1 Tax=Xanthomonas fragariae TaxID=48664 RepID=A0A1Y6GSJ7_9XANT|nr:hypothetical protein [Xanthomonas fragariae]AOD17140.1 hypothetical protein BER93_02145 [Xanthomonas fragariae]ENZ93565.1 hypothetical protein O1K_20437 [Xanthomonas fragariae LMG 25863]MBL9197475.1 hypothetical protein [Xanthomonas fragariae]MBL9222612.1 hypothetical protein [Xanthomonas fragariae]MDM7582305.1 hypothetical protein [Xanthomonas fragariae]
MLSQETTSQGPGKYVFLVEGKLACHAHEKVRMKIGDAIARQAEYSLEQFRSVIETQREQQSRQQGQQREQSISPPPRTM